VRARRGEGDAEREIAVVVFFLFSFGGVPYK
jgi:hypothetical protein